jgi:Thioesterase-like superfamily
MTLHMEFPRRTETGPATFHVKDVKLGRQTSTVHITLRQHDRDEVIAYITQSNLSSSAGVSFDTEWALHPTPYAVDLSKLKDGEDENWVEQRAMPFSNFRKASNRVRFFFPRHGQKMKSLSDQWLCFRNGERFTTEALGYVCDMFPQVVESFKADEDPYGVTEEKSHAGANRALAKFWYPTVVLNLDVKKALPEEGVEWLYARSSSKVIRNGRLDIEVVIMDESGEIVALSHHVTLVLDAARNLAQRRRNGNGSGGESKI